jgi:phage tail sheath gpL-like
MSINPTSVAAAVAAGVKNVQFAVEARNVPRKMLIIGTYDPLKTSVVDDVPVQIFSPEDAGDKFGFGFMVHRLAVKAFKGAQQSIPAYVVPQSEAGGAVAATGDIDWAGTAGVKAGTLALYIANIRVPVAITDGMTLEEVSDAVVAAVNAIKELPVTAAKRAVTFETDFTSKTKGPWGNEISIALNLGFGEVLPDGIVAAITGMSGGATNPDISTALDGLGTGDDANADFFTEVVHGYGQETAVLDAISTYVGPGDDFTGLYKKTVARPFRALTGDTDPGTSALTALKALADGRKLDRANIVIAVPDSADHPSEIAAQTIGIMALVNQTRAAQGYIDEVLEGVHPGDQADRWTSEYTDRDDAVKNGISTTQVKSGVVTIQNMVTFYRPDSVPIASNAYRRARDISIHQNILDNIRANFAREKWQGIIIVKDVTNVANTEDRKKARDINMVIDDLVALARQFADRAWIYDDGFTINALKQSSPPPVVERSGLTGFDSTMKVLLSGEGGIMDTTVEADASIAILSA